MDVGLKVCAVVMDNNIIITYVNNRHVLTISNHARLCNITVPLGYFIAQGSNQYILVATHLIPLNSNSQVLILILLLFPAI